MFGTVAVTIAKDSRLKESKANNDVGPGRYHIKSFLDKQKIPGVTRFPRTKCFRGPGEISLERRSIEGNPGPGQYDLRSFLKTEANQESSPKLNRHRSTEDI
jgi:hypothetical protein